MLGGRFNDRTRWGKERLLDALVLAFMVAGDVVVVGAGLVLVYIGVFDVEPGHPLSTLVLVFFGVCVWIAAWPLIGLTVRACTTA